ncbi:hypothetical protein ACP4OV_004048 [Aristida adscensionis]
MIAFPTSSPTTIDLNHRNLECVRTVQSHSHLLQSKQVATAIDLESAHELQRRAPLQFDLNEPCEIDPNEEIFIRDFAIASEGTAPSASMAAFSTADSVPEVASSSSTDMQCSDESHDVHCTDEPPDTDSTVSCTGWEKRPRLGKIEDEQSASTEGTLALQKAIKNYALRKGGLVVLPTVGMSFDCMAEAYDFYNLYSWEVGFGIRYARCRRNIHKTKTVQDIVCA